MNRTPIFQKNETAIITRLTALWALNEAGLGGVMHLIRTPFTGVFVGGFAVILISMIGYFSSKPGWDILKALIIVLIIKGIASPHSPPTAYIAVAFQGLLGALFFTTLPSFRIAALLLGMLALLESAIQKLLVMTILFGKPLWQSLNAFIDFVLQNLRIILPEENVHGGYWLAGVYVAGYTLAGIGIGWLAGRLPSEIKAVSESLQVPDTTADEQRLNESTAIKKRKHFWQRRSFQGIVLSLGFILLIQTFIPESRSSLKPLWIFLRVLGILAIWYTFVVKLLLPLAKRLLLRQSSKYQLEINQILDLLPLLRNSTRNAWKETHELKGFKRITGFITRAIAYALIMPDQPVTK